MIDDIFCVFIYYVINEATEHLINEATEHLINEATEHLINVYIYYII